MADLTTRYWPIYVNNVKVAVAHEQTYDVNPNKGNLFAAEGWTGLSIGAAHTQVQIQGIDPVGGSNIDFVALTLQSGMFTVGVLRPDGTFKQHTMGATNFQAKTNSETGRSDLSFTLMGGPPKSL